MEERETAEAIDLAATEWVGRLEREDMDGSVHADLDAWLAADVRRKGAFFRAQAAWAMLDRASALRGGNRSGQGGAIAVAGVASLSPTQDSRGAGIWAEAVDRRRFLGRVGLAAAMAAGVGALLVWRDPEQPIETTLGEIRRVPLKDGSLVAINTASRIGVDMTAKVRRIDLVQGEAWFQVAKDRDRPFIVEAGDVRARAVGTAFSVRRYDDGASIRVTEGVVEIWSILDPTRVQRVEADGSSFVARDAPLLAPTVDGDKNDRALAWRSGQLVFDGDTLEAAAEEFNRYNAVRVVVIDPNLKAEKLVGRFHTNEPEAFARAAAGMLSAKAEFDGQEIRLKRD